MSAFLTIIKSILSVALMLFRYAFYRAISSFLTGLVLLSIAVLMFATFYQAYMPVVSHVKPVYLQFSSDCHGEPMPMALCTYPEASVFFTSSNKANEERMLMRGQAYKVFLDLEMPPSPTNEKLGMFMVNVKFLSSKGTVLKSSSRSCMLHYESYLVRLFRTIFYSLPLTLGISEEKQKVELNLFDDYIDDSYNPAVQAKVVIMTRQVEIYSSTLRLQASFTGLRYLIFNWPVFFSCIAVMGNFITVTLLYSACINQFTPKTTSTATNSVVQQQNARSVQQENASVETSSASTSTAVTTTSASNVETVSSNVERPPEQENIASTSEHEDIASTSEHEDIPSISCKVRKRRVTRIASVKLKFHKKQPRILHADQRRIKKVKITREEIPDVVQESVNDGDTTQNGVNQELTTPDKAGDINELMDDAFGHSSGNTGVVLDGIQMTSRCSPSRISHVRKRRKTEYVKQPGSQSTTWRITSIVADNSGKNRHKEKSSENKENKTGLCEMTDSPNRLKSVWENFCFAKNWESFKLPRVQRLGMYLQETMPSVSSQNIRHCVSDLELSTVEERRLLSDSGTPRRSVSASDISLLQGGTTSTAMSELCQ